MMYFYPKNDTPGCNIEAGAFASKLKDFEAKNALVLGVSADSVESHSCFRVSVTAKG